MQLVNDGSIWWIYRKRISKYTFITPENEDVKEGKLFKTLIKAEEWKSLGASQNYARRKSLNKWDEIKEVLRNKSTLKLNINVKNHSKERS